MKYIILFMLLAGCSSHRLPEYVYVPVPSDCVVNYPEKPDLYTKEQLKALSPADYVIQITIDYFKLEEYSDKQHASTAGCRTKPKT
jgi:hypothetical protein